jgi:hypothetical protein
LAASNLMSSRILRGSSGITVGMISRGDISASCPIHQGRIARPS